MLNASYKKEGETMSLKKYLVSGAAALALAGGALATTVSIEQDGTGNYLIAPAYYAIANWETGLKVVNTNTTAAVVAKVVIREANSSREILDFPIYLTPGDVWVGTLKQENGNVKIVSNDDSNMFGLDLNDTGDLVGPQLAGSLDKTVTVQDGDIVTRGYVEIIGLAEYNQTVLQTWDPNWKEGCPYDKTIFFTKVRDKDNPTWLNFNDAEQVAGDDLIGMQTIYAEAADPAGRRNMMLNMKALSIDGVTSDQLQNALKKAISADTTYIADVGATDALHTALLKKKVYVMYESKDAPLRVHFTYPYKNIFTTYQIQSNTTEFRNLEENMSRCFDSAHPNNCVNTSSNDFSGFVYTCPTKDITTELGIIINNPGDDWMNRYAFDQGGYISIDLGTDGLPIIPTTMYAKDVQGLYLNNHLYNQYAK